MRSLSETGSKVRSLYLHYEPHICSVGIEKNKYALADLYKTDYLNTPVDSSLAAIILLVLIA